MRNEDGQRHKGLCMTCKEIWCLTFKIQADTKRFKIQRSKDRIGSGATVVKKGFGIKIAQYCSNLSSIPLTSVVTLGKLLTQDELQFAHL